jgi:hypothetical protein
MSLRILYVAIGTTAVFSILISLITGKLGNAVVSYLQRKYYLDYNDAITIYRVTLRNNKDVIIIVAGAVGFSLF